LKAFLLAAGDGRRLRPLTDTMPKCLVPIRGTPLLAVWLALLEQHGVTDVLLNLHHAHERVVEFLAAARTSIAVSTVYEEQLLGSAGTVLANRRFVEGEQTFLILYADNLTNVDLTRMRAFHDTRPRPMTIGVAPTDRPREKGTVVVGDDGQVLAFEEKPETPRSNLANAGIYAAGQGLFEHLERSAVNRPPFDFGHHVFPAMAPHLTAYPIDEYLLDIGTPDSYARCQLEWPGLLTSARPDGRKEADSLCG
jgi:mannose-1-phosphate guanylyltransferase